MLGLLHYNSVFLKSHTRDAEQFNDVWMIQMKSKTGFTLNSLFLLLTARLDNFYYNVFFAPLGLVDLAVCAIGKRLHFHFSNFFDWNFQQAFVDQLCKCFDDSRRRQEVIATRRALAVRTFAALVAAVGAECIAIDTGYKRTTVDEF